MDAFPGRCLRRRPGGGAARGGHRRGEAQPHPPGQGQAGEERQAHEGAGHDEKVPSLTFEEEEIDALLFRTSKDGERATNSNRNLIDAEISIFNFNSLFHFTQSNTIYTDFQIGRFVSYDNNCLKQISGR